MLYYVSGTVAVLEPGLAVIDCGGVGYGCRVTAYTASQLKLRSSQSTPRSTESPRQDKPKEEHTKIHNNQIDKN